MADTTALEAVAARHGGSSPLLGTKTEKYTPQGYFFCFVFGLEANLNAAFMADEVKVADRAEGAIATD